MKNLPQGACEQTLDSDVRIHEKDIEEMIKRVFAVAQIVASASIDCNASEGQERQAVQKHKLSHLQ